MAYLQPLSQSASSSMEDVTAGSGTLTPQIEKPDTTASSILFLYNEQTSSFPQQKKTLKDRLKHFTFAWFACTMSTGGIAFVLSVVPNRFNGLTTLGTVIFVLNLILFLLFTVLITLRFILHSGTLSHALTNPHEGFFLATFFLSTATIISNTTAYGIPHCGPWLLVALRVAFWVYTFCATMMAIFYYHVLFSVQKLDIKNVLPGWVLPMFPAMLVGTLASAIAKTQTAEQALPMLVAGLSYQGLGMMVAMMMYSLYFGRLLTSGLPADMSRPAMFIAAGPPAFTALAFIGMAEDVTATELARYLTTEVFPDPELVEDVLKLMALIAAIFLWMLTAWFFAIALIATIESSRRNRFRLNWYAYVFPNVGFTIATIKIGQQMNSAIVMAVGTGMVGCLFCVWVLVVVCHVKAVWQKQICWEGMDEDCH